MILLVGVFLGLIVLAFRGVILRRPVNTLQLRGLWLIPIAFVPQFLAFFSNVNLQDSWIPPIQIGTQAILLLFVALNINKPGLVIFGMGTLMNFLVITLNGGFMPTNLDAARYLYPHAADGFLQLGQRLGHSKDMLIALADTKLWMLSDCLLLPQIGDSYRVIFSLGDILIAVGAGWMVGAA